MDSSTGRMSSADFLAQLRSRRQGSIESMPLSQQPSPSLAEPVPNPTTPTTSSLQPDLPPQSIAFTQPQPVNNNPEPSPSTSFQTTADPELFAHLQKPVSEELIVSWEAPSRPFKKRNRQYYTTIAAIVFLVSLILFFAGQFLPIAVVISVGFLSYILSSVPPENVVYTITNYGIYIDKNLHYWEEMGRFWYTQKFGMRILNIEVARFPGRLSIIIGDLDEVELTSLLSEVLVNEKPADTYFDRMANWIQAKVPLEVEEKKPTA